MGKVKVTILKPCGMYLKGPAEVDENQVSYMLSKGLIELRGEDAEAQAEASTEEEGEQQVEAPEETHFQNYLSECLSDNIVETLKVAGYTTQESLENAGDNNLSSLSGIGARTVSRIRKMLEEYEPPEEDE